MKLAGNQCLILGPPGCGKTTALLNLVEKYLDAGTHPKKIAYLSFTRKAVQEAKTRALARRPFDEGDLRYFRTIHALTFALNGLTKNDVMSKEHYTELGNHIGVRFGEGHVDETTGMPIGNAEGDHHLFVYSLARARRVSLQEQWEASNIPDLDLTLVDRTVRSLEKYKKLHGLVDFTDMLQTYVDTGQPLDIDIAFIDEAQDLSVLQWEVLRKMLSRATTIYVAGDDDQAIYRWSGADVETFMQLEGYQTVLATSWRCPQQVHRMANSISTRIQHRLPKLWGPRDERGSVQRGHTIEAVDLEGLQGTTLCLARNIYLLGPYYGELRKRGLPYWTNYGGHSVQRSHAKAIYAWERLRRGQTATADEIKTIYDQLRVGIGVRRGFKSLGKLLEAGSYTIEDLRKSYGLMAESKPWFDVLDAIAGKDIAYYRSILRAKRNLVDDPVISVNTIHGVKGGEADNVILNPDMALKSYNDFLKNPDDEHRVAYVGVSRARRTLMVLAPRTKNCYPYFQA